MPKTRTDAPVTRTTVSRLVPRRKTAASAVAPAASNVIALSPVGPAETKDRTLDSAQQLVREPGYEATGLRAITGAAGVNRAAVNSHFGSEEELFQSVLTRRL